MNSFKSLNLSKEMIENLDSLKYQTMTPIQEKSIPLIIKGKDILAQAKTGSGKTAAFGIGLLNNLNVKRFRIQALVLCPTRELAEQVTGELRRLAKFRHNIKLLKITGGFPMYKQEHSLRHKAHIVVGTPGRIQRLLQRGSLNLDDLSMIVLDEADRMLDMGFIDQIEDIFSYTSPSVQTLLYSATFSDSIKELGRKILNNPEEVIVETNHDPRDIRQLFYSAGGRDKIRAVSHVLNRFKPDSVIIFCNTKDSCRRVCAELKKTEIESLALHGDLEQKERTEILIRFSNKSSRVLVATDVAARGIDIDKLGAVINYDMPFDTETYIHRIGRTGRAGSKGLAISLIKNGEEFRLDDINIGLMSSFTEEVIDFETHTDSKMAEPEMITLSVNGGRRNKVSAGDLLGALTSEGGVSGNDVGKIDRLDYITFVGIRREASERAFKMLNSCTIKGKHFKVMKHH